MGAGGRLVECYGAAPNQGLASNKIFLLMFSNLGVLAIRLEGQIPMDFTTVGYGLGILQIQDTRMNRRLSVDAVHVLAVPGTGLTMLSCSTAWLGFVFLLC